ncbi:MAG TPA: SCP2 sterol-binding domain-containing protein [Mycobacteriales bacterium]|jgi:predicted lipid carrier protein YhbT|nr:SCP2 sterol-binding domain-containing protein [Mycobacteriales bacterium]
MAAVEDCEQALQDLAARLADIDPDLRRRHSVERTLSLHVTDLDTSWTGCLQDGELRDLVMDDDSAGRAQIRLTARSDDVLALAAGELNFALAWASGRLRVDANPLDLLRLRALL